MMWGEGLEMHTKPWVRARARRAYWENMKPASGRPYCPAMSCPDNWGVTKGDAILVQQEEATRADRRGAENPDGEIENVNSWTQSEFMSNGNSDQDLRKTPVTLSMYSDVLDELIATLMHEDNVEDVHFNVDDRHD